MRKNIHISWLSKYDSTPTSIHRLIANKIFIIYVCQQCSISRSGPRRYNLSTVLKIIPAEKKFNLQLLSGASVKHYWLACMKAGW